MSVDPKPITIGTMLQVGTIWLRGRGDGEARLVVELLLARALDIDRAGVYARLSQPLSSEAQARFESLLTRRANGEPVAYILGEREFYGLRFLVRPGVLVPRPETELLVEQALEFVRASAIRAPRILDVGTGSGAVAIAIAKHLPHATVLATDISDEAASVARENVALHDLQTRVHVQLSDLLSSVEGEWDVLVANLPYIPSSIVETLETSVRDWEPRLALDGGADGLRLHEALLGQVTSRVRSGGLVVLEVADDRGPAAVDLARLILPGADVELLSDTFGRDRAVRAIVP